MDCFVTLYKLTSAKKADFWTQKTVYVATDIAVDLFLSVVSDTDR